MSEVWVMRNMLGLAPRASHDFRPPEKEGVTGVEAVVDKETENSKPPPFYKVMILDDDFTPMEFVVLVLVKNFRLSEEAAVQLMLQVHHEGRAVCGVYPKDIAQTKVESVRKMAKEHHHPLACEWEENQ